MDHAGQSAEEDRNALETIINDIVHKSNAELKQKRQKQALNVLKMTEQTTSSSNPLRDIDVEVKKEMGQFANIQSKVSPYVVTDTLAAFVLRSVAMNQDNHFNVDMKFTVEEVDRLINLCVDLINMDNSPQMETVKMQVYFDTHFPSQADFLNREKLGRTQACAAMLKEITDVKAKSINIFEVLYRKVCSYVLVKSCAGNPTDIRIVREGTAALESVFPQSELGTFIPMTRTQKEVQLNGLTQLVTGIRLFNKQLGKGGETIDNLPELCADELQDMTTSVGQLTTETEESIQMYLAIIDYSTKVPNTLPSEISIPRVKQGLAFRRQLLMYLDALQDQMTRSKSTLLQLSTKFDASIVELKNSCRAKSAISVDQVYPHFIILASLWTNWLDELFLLSFRRGIIDVLNYHVSTIQIPVSELVKLLCTPYMKDIEAENLNDQDIVTAASELMVSLASVSRSIDVIHPGNTTQYFSLPVEFGGYCPVTVMYRDGLIVPGNKNIGLLRYNDNIYSFAGPREAKEFAKSPMKFVEGLVQRAKSNPELIQLLHLYQYFPTVDALERRLLGKMPMVSEAGSQVDTHIVDGYIDPKYQWNEWELRKNALMLVNLKTKRTHGAQTVKSHFKRDNETQHYAPISQVTQTNRDGSTNVPKRVNFLAGLRHDGRSGTSRFKVVDLTLNL